MDGFKIAELALSVPAGVLILISLVFKNQLKFRITNLIGSLVFIGYGIALAVLSGLSTGWMTIILNSVGSVAHIVFIVGMVKERHKSSIKKEHDEREHDEISDKQQHEN